MDKENKGKPRIVVTIFREYAYPKSMLHPVLFLEDAKEKAVKDIRIEMNELVKNEMGQLNEQFFSMEVEEDRAFKLRDPFDNGNKGRRKADKIDIHKAITALTIAHMETKYNGPLDPEKNPTLFDQQAAVVIDGRALRDETYYLKPEIEEEYRRTNEMYFGILSKLLK